MLKRGFNGVYTCLHSFRSLTLYSTSVISKNVTTSPPMVEFLVKSVGFSEEEAIPIATKVSLISKSTAKQPKLVVDLLKRTGFDETQIRILLTHVPQLLRCKVAKTLEPKIRVLQELGFCSSNLGLLVSHHPYLLSRSLKGFIAPLIEVLKSLFDNDEELLSLLLKPRSQRLLSSNALNYLPDNLMLLQSYGVPSPKIKYLLLQRPLLFIQKPQWLEKKVRAAERKLGIPRTSAMFVHGVSAMSMISDQRLESWIRAFRGYGWSEVEISTLLKRHPKTLNLSAALVGVKLRYFMEGLGYRADYLAVHPVLLSLSLEKRILPRTALVKGLKERRLVECNVDFYNLMCKAESKFLELYLLPYKDKAPVRIICSRRRVVRCRTLPSILLVDNNVIGVFECIVLLLLTFS